MKNGVGIVGYGVVGASLLRLFTSNERDVPKVAIYDPAKGLDDKQAVNDRAITFVCVPTPSGPDGRCDTSMVEESVAWIESDVIVIRSTVPPGTTDRLREKYGKRIVFQPEYLGETADHPMVGVGSQRFAVLGGPIEDTAPVADLYKRFFNSDLRFYFCTAICAELAKYMENAFYATKVTFCNEFYDIAQALGVDYNELREAWLADPRISRDHTFVYPANRGFSGKCLPKDTSAIIQAAHERGIFPQLLAATMTANTRYRDGDDTWDQYAKLFSQSLAPELPADRPSA